MAANLAMPFLDSSEPDEHGPARESLSRPWKAWWPPEAGSDLHALLQQTVPEVLSWRFNPKDPFDRPWQWWTKLVFQNGRVCRAQAKPPSSQQQQQQQQAQADGSLETAQQGQAGAAPDGHLHCRAGGQKPANQLDDLAAPQTAVSPRHVCVDRKEGTRRLDAENEVLGLPYVVPSQINYLADDPLFLTTKPFHTRLPFLGDIRRSNTIVQGYSGVKIHDIRGHEDKFTLDESGFEYLPIPVGITEWSNETAKEIYVPAMEAWLKGYFQAEQVHVYTFSFRSEDSARTSNASWIGPHMRAHCDVTLNSGLRRLDLHLPDEAEKIKAGRWRMIGIWRALTNPYQDRPLAVLDSRSICPDDFLGTDVVFPHYCDEGYEVRYSPLHRWYYRSGMTLDDTLVFKHYDSSTDVVQFCPHAAFVDPSAPAGTPPRASIEIRAIVIG